MTSQKRAPHRDSDKHWPFLLEVARTLYGNAQFAASLRSVLPRRFSVFRSVLVSKFEERLRKYNLEQIKTLLNCKELKQSGKWENFLTPQLDTFNICSPTGKCFQRILIKFFKESLIIVQKFRSLCRSRKSRNRTRYSISLDFREKQRDLRIVTFQTAGPFRAVF